MTPFKQSGWLMIEPGVELTPAAISPTVAKGIIAFEEGTGACPPEGLWTTYNDKINDKVSTYCKRTQEGLCPQSEYQMGLETAIDIFQKEFSSGRSFAHKKNRNKSK